jgi:transposase
MDVADNKPLDGRAAPRNLDQWVDMVADAFADLKKAEQRLEVLEKKYAELKAENAELKAENAELKKQLANTGTEKLAEPYSMRAEEQRQEARGTKKKKRKETKKQRRGRIANEEKIRRAEKTEDIYPLGIPPEQCQLSHVRVVWRLLEGRAVLVAYRIFRGPKKQYGVIPGVLGRSEYSLEIVVELAFLVRQIGLSLDKVCQVVGFLQKLNLRKSQVEALLKQLSQHWSAEFEVLCTLLANSLVVHADETSWSIRSVWAFLSEKARVLLFGVPKDGKTLQTILDPETFVGTVFSDDAAVYGNFTKAQKCWAHLLRKAIKLTLQDPEHQGYRGFADELLDIYHEANRIRRDQRLGEDGRERKVKELLRQLFRLCGPVRREQQEAAGLGHDWWLLAEELVRLGLADELFTFVLNESVEQPNGALMPPGGTNNAAERTLRGAAEARKTCRTSKTPAGARRTTILTSVLESLRLYLAEYTLENVINEVMRWQQTGCSCFRELLKKLKIADPDESVLDRVLPLPSG